MKATILYFMHKKLTRYYNTFDSGFAFDSVSVIYKGSVLIV